MPLTNPRVFLFTMGLCLAVFGGLLAIVAALGAIAVLVRPEATLSLNTLAATGLIGLACLWLGNRWRKRARDGFGIGG
jgi:hypothetical protein